MISGIKDTFDPRHMQRLQRENRRYGSTTEIIEVETKKLETFEVCRRDCTYENNIGFDDPIYISRVEMLLNNGKKKKHLYFQSDYNIKTTDTYPDGDEGEGEMVGTPGG